MSKKVISNLKTNTILGGTGISAVPGVQCGGNTGTTSVPPNPTRDTRCSDAKE